MIFSFFNFPAYFRIYYEFEKDEFTPETLKQEKLRKEITVGKNPEIFSRYCWLSSKPLNLCVKMSKFFRTIGFPQRKGFCVIPEEWKAFLFNLVEQEEDWPKMQVYYITDSGERIREDTLNSRKRTLF